MNPVPVRPPALADTLNRQFRCITLNEAALMEGLSAAVGDAGLLADIRRERPHLFSATAVFVAPADVARMQTVIDAIETVVALPAFRERVLAWAPASARFEPAAAPSARGECSFGNERSRRNERRYFGRSAAVSEKASPREPAAGGVFLGYDFHPGPSGPQLIEVNTNAGGAALNAVLGRAQRACCREVEDFMTAPADPAQVEDDFIAMFREEWRRQRGDAPLRTIAIVDDRPTEQYLHPEFRLFEALFRRHGIEAVIADPGELMICHGNLWHGETRIDLVYNRLTDFALDEPGHTALREAYLNSTVVVTPHPRAHALYADKRNLTLLTDEAFLRSLGLPPETIATLLTGIPRTVMVTPDQADEFWRTRKQWFFKPAAGFGSRAAYRGDKLTRRVFEEILQGQYVAQARVEPGERLLPTAHGELPLKFDLRCYVYDGRVQLLAARLFQGQTTNFRTAGGGFAPVFYAPAPAA